MLEAEAGTVWQFDPDTNELELRVARGLDPIRVPADRGIVGECVRTRATINVPDCYTDPRFNPDIDKASGTRTRCMLTLPLIGYEEQLVSSFRCLTRDGVFDADDKSPARCRTGAVALQRSLTESCVGG